MTLSKPTIAILKNFSRISPCMVIRPGNLLQIRSKAVWAEAKISETFPCEARLHDIQHFLSLLASFKKPTLDWKVGGIRITEHDGSSVVLHETQDFEFLPADKRRKPLPEERIDFVMTATQWATISKAIKARYLLRFVSDGRTLGVQPFRMKDRHSDITVLLDAKPNGVQCEIVFDSANFPLMQGGYVGVLAHGFGEFTGLDVRYLIAPQRGISSFGPRKDTSTCQVDEGSKKDNFGGL